MSGFHPTTVLFFCIVIALIATRHGTNAADGGWGFWTNWKRHCSASCGDPSDGFRYRTRVCDNPEPSDGGQPCQGPPLEKSHDICHLRPCPVVWRWGAWTTWMRRCSATCGDPTSGVRYRTRVCYNSAPSQGGLPCPGPAKQKTADVCHMKPCPDPTTTGPPTTTQECKNGDSKVENCYSFYCHQGRWSRFEFTATMACCEEQRKHSTDVHPRCHFFYPDTTTEPPTTTLECKNRDSKEENCFFSYCWEGRWTPSEFIATRKCCEKHRRPSSLFYWHPRCRMMFPDPTTTEPSTTTTEPPTTTTEPSTTTTEPPTTTMECKDGYSKVENCYSFYCSQGRWARFEFTATQQCCEEQRKHSIDVHPRCHVFFPDPTITEPPTSTEPPTTMGPPTTTHECKNDDSKVENCYSFYCYQGRWSRFEFTATMACCEEQRKHSIDVHPRCHVIFPDIF